MEYSSRIAKMNRTSRKTKTSSTGQVSSILETMISVYDTPNGCITSRWKHVSSQLLNQNQNQIDPTAIQPGQSVYDQTGGEYLVMEQEDNLNDQTVLVPAETANQPAPTGVKVVDSGEMQSGYNVNNPTEIQAEAAGSIIPAAGDDLETKKKVSPCTSAGSDTNIADGLTEDKRAYLSALRSIVGRRAVDQSEFEGGIDRVNELEESFNEGTSGYTEIMNFIHDKADIGMEAIDIVLLVGEKWDRTLGQKVLNDARAKGII